MRLLIPLHHTDPNVMSDADVDDLGVMPLPTAEVTSIDEAEA